MNNQAAQTMQAMTPERCSFFLRRFKNDEKMLGPNEQLALDYAIAALSQTAGVAEGLVVVPRDPTPEMIAAVTGMTESVRVAEDCYDEWPVSAELFTEAYRAMIAAAPAASGGEDVLSFGDVTTRFIDGMGWVVPCSDAMKYVDAMRAGAAVMDSMRAGNLPAGASVSVAQRLRDAIEGECDGLGITEECAESILRYIGFHPQGRIVGGREIDGVWVIEATSHSDLMPNQQLVRYDDYRRALEQALTQQRGECEPIGYVHPDTIKGMRAGMFVKAIFFYKPIPQVRADIPLYLAPQPGAEDLRTVIASMSNFADVADQCELTEHNAQTAIRSWVTQLESLLGRGG